MYDNDDWLCRVGRLTYTMTATATDPEATPGEVAAVIRLPGENARLAPTTGRRLRGHDR